MNVESQMKSAIWHLQKHVDEIPPEFVRHAKGLVFMTMLKGAFIWSGAASSGIIIKRLSENKWDPLRF